MNVKSRGNTLRMKRHSAEPPFMGNALVWFASVAMGIVIIGLIIVLQSGGTPGKRSETALPSGVGPGQMQLINTPVPTGIGSGQMQLIKQDVPFLGLSLSALPPDVAARAGLDINQGVYVNNVVPSSPAEKAGIAAGEVITRIEGTDLTTPDSVGLFLSNKMAGDVVKAVIIHGGTKRSVHVTLDKRVDPPLSF